MYLVRTGASKENIFLFHKKKLFKNINNIKKMNEHLVIQNSVPNTLMNENWL